MADYIKMFEDLYRSNPKLGKMALNAYGKGGLTGLLGQLSWGTSSPWQPKPKPAQAAVEQPIAAPMSRPTYNPTMYQMPTFNPDVRNNMASFLAAGQAPQMQMPFVNPAEMYRTYNIGSAPQMQPSDYMPYKLRQPRTYEGLNTKPMMEY